MNKREPIRVRTGASRGERRTMRIAMKRLRIADEIVQQHIELAAVRALVAAMQALR